MASTISFINIKGEVLIYRCFKYDVSRQETMEFVRKIISTKEAKEKPIISMNGVSYIHTTISEITILATTKSNINVGMLLDFLYSLAKICKSYFNEFSEASIKKNFVLIYELIDETMDYGFPQITEVSALQQYITQKGIKDNQKDLAKLQAALTQVTNAIAWRKQGIVYKVNQVHIDVIENMNLLLTKSGDVIKSEVIGKVVVKSNLSGMPECKFGMNDKLALADANTTGTNGITIEDIKFHQCVRLSDFKTDRTITFIPPDGSFELMSYRVTENVIIPFKIYTNIIETPSLANSAIPTSIDVDLTVKSLFEKLLFAQEIVIRIPVPSNATNVKCHTNVGKAKYESNKGAIMWRIKKMFGDKESKLKCEVPLLETNDPKPWVREPIRVEFQLPMFTSSGLRVRHLKVIEKEDYKTTKWIRYLVKNGDFCFRI